MSAVTNVGNLSVGISVQSAQLQAGLAAAVAQTQAAGAKMQTSMAVQPSKGGFGGMGGFAQTVGRIADDAQYGFRGIVNNLEQLGQSAGSAFGLASKDAMALGAVMTLLGVAINQASDDLLKFTDGRTEFEKMADSVTAYSGSLNVAEAAMKALATETSAASKSDATTGVGAFFGRVANFLKDGETGVNEWRDVNKLFNPTKSQLDANKASGEKVQRGQIDLTLMSGKTQRDRGGFNAGASLLDRGRNAIDVESNKDAAKVFAEAIKGKEEVSNFLLQKQLQAGGVNALQSEIESLKLLGFASEGVVAAFEDIDRRLPELKLSENLAGINTAKDTEMNMANLANQFRDDQKKAKEISGLEDKSSTIRGRISDLMDQRARSEIVGSSDVFARNLNAGQTDPVVTAIEKQTEELKTLTREIATLG